jgi:diadenosine tetraphosphate (Ap4A) HIT family hydrolase
MAPMNATMAKFGYPDTLVAEYDSWVVLVRPQQATLGALVLVCKEPAAAFSQISAAAFGELGGAVRDIEAALAAAFVYDKINYLMLMMVDPNVHFHVIPRYAEERRFEEVAFIDAGWPRLPDLAKSPALAPAMLGRIRDRLKQHWATQSARAAG